MEFVGPAQANIGEIVEAWQARSAGGVEAGAHKLKSSARIVGANCLADTCLALETAAKAEDWESIDRCASELDALMQGAAAYVESL